ncbi:hypothetical protein [Vibrio olivae]|uniref:Uncharacterized protein n=1 Tax=Vibrio olivae TaxID=1243002 RepID=A0ABV5HPU1_9VIBR
MIPLLAAVVFIIALGKKVELPKSLLLFWPLLTVVSFLFTPNSAIAVLLSLFVCSPFIIHFRSLRAKHVLFSTCVVCSCLLAVTIQSL